VKQAKINGEKCVLSVSFYTNNGKKFFTAIKWKVLIIIINFYVTFDVHLTDFQYLLLSES